MNKSTSLRRILLAPPSVRGSMFALRATQPAVANSRGYATLGITQPSFWKIMIPKPFRKDSQFRSATKKPKSKEWNPATFFIFIFLLIGSMSIQMIALRNEFIAYTRRADAKIGLLKEVIERVQKGEEVDVEGLLGTGDARREKEWEEVLQEIVEEDQAWAESRKPKPSHGRNKETKEADKEIDKGTGKETNKETTTVSEPASKPAEQTKPDTPSGFY